MFQVYPTPIFLIFLKTEPWMSLKTLDSQDVQNEDISDENESEESSSDSSD